MNRNRRPAIFGCVLLLQALCANAESFYVGDRLQIGLHMQPTLSSTIVELLPSGTELELIERSGSLARVRTVSGAEGWVDGEFISSVQPANERLQAMEAELAGTQAALADLQAKLVLMEQHPEQVASERAAEQSVTLPSDALREMQSLAEENQRLKQQIAEFEAVRRMAQERSAGSSAANDSATATMLTASAIDTDDDIVNIANFKHWHLLLFGSVLLLAFSVGGWLVDWGIRRRHGGFRI